MRCVPLLLLSVFLPVLVLLPSRALAGAADEETFTATSVAWLSIGDDGIFFNPRPLASGDGLLGVAFEERHQAWSCAGFSRYRPEGFEVTLFPRVERIRGVAAAALPGGEAAVLYGCERGVFLARSEKGAWSVEAVSGRSGEAFGVAVVSGGALTAFFSQDGENAAAPVIARRVGGAWSFEPVETEEGRSAEGGAQPRLPSRVGPGALAVGPDGRPAAVFLEEAGGRARLMRARREAGGWTARPQAAHLWGVAPEGRFGLAFDGRGRLRLAYQNLPGRELYLADLDGPGQPVEEPDPGCVVRWPHVDLAYDRLGNGNLICFALTPDGGLQVRLTRWRDGRWHSRMVDRTMSHASTASLSLCLVDGREPFLAYALGPARRVLLAFPKHAAPPGVGLLLLREGSSIRKKRIADSK